MKIALCQINPTVGDLEGNLQKIIDFIKRAKKMGAELVIFPELATTGYFPFDLIHRSGFVEDVERINNEVKKHSHGIGVILGTITYTDPEKPIYNAKDPSSIAYGGGRIYHNSALFFHNKKLIFKYNKIKLPSFDIYNEERYFIPGDSAETVEFKGMKIGINICEDIWFENGPYEEEVKKDADLIINISASPFFYDKPLLRFNMVSEKVKKSGIPTIYLNLVGAQDEVIFDGNSFVLNGEGKPLKKLKGFEEDMEIVELESKPIEITFYEKYESIYNALILGIKDYFRKNGLKKAIVGLSGGVDSALVLALGAFALGRENITALFLPSRYTSTESAKDAEIVAKNLGIKLFTISIDRAFNVIRDSLHPIFGARPFDITEENIQARIRGLLLMAYANKFGGMVLSTGNKSEIAVGYNTLYGDTVGGIAVIGDLYKRDVYHLCGWINENIQDVFPESLLTKPPSAELRKDQKDEDDLPPYSILDRVLEGLIEKNLGYKELLDIAGNRDVLEDILKRYYRNEYKRKQLPIVLKVSPKAFGTGRRMPITGGYRR